MNIALIIAGGSGQRMNQDIPKQFLNIENRPVIIYTLEAFQRHPSIDAIEVVCLSGWEEILKAYAKQFNITKLMGIVKGGDNGQSSCTMLLELGETLHFSAGSEKNIKLTTTADVDIFRALLAVKQIGWMK